MRVLQAELKYLVGTKQLRGFFWRILIQITCCRNMAGHMLGIVINYDILDVLTSTWLVEMNIYKIVQIRIQIGHFLLLNYGLP